MAVKKPKVAKKSGFDIEAILKFIESQAVGQKSKDLFQEAADIEVPPMGAGKDMFGVAPQTQAYISKGGKGIEALANTGLGQWFGADSAYNLGKPKQSATDSVKNIANLLFSTAPLGAGKVLKKVKGGAVGTKGATNAVNDFASIIKLLMGRQDK
jgi:hypothetical protein